MKRSFLVRNPAGASSVFPVDKTALKIGRLPDNDIVLLDPERSVSRLHAVVSVDDTDGLVFVSDQKSANGTFVNGERINGQHRLVPNDVIRLGQFELTLREEAPEENRFAIEAGSVELAELQQKQGLLPLPGEGPAELKNLELLYEVGVTLARSHSVEEVTAAAIGLLFKIEQVHRATVMLWDDNKQTFKSTELHARNVGKVGPMPQPYDPSSVVMSQTILRRVRQQNRPLLIRDAKSEAMLESAASIVRAGIQAAFCSPLSFQGRFLGILYADNLAEPQAFSEADFRTFTSIAAQTGLALANALATRQLLQREAERQALKLYLPPQVADLIVASGGTSQLQGRLQKIAVLFADIRGFTTMSEKMQPREVVQMLNEYFTAMSGLIFDCNGTLDKFIGDCIMAIFGAPVASPAAAREALNAAIRMQRRMEEVNSDRVRRSLDPFRVGIGLHCGAAVVGNIGSLDRLQYTAIGDTVNVAARLVSKAAPSQIIVSQEIRHAIPDYDGFESLGEVELKGRTEKVNIFSAKWAEFPIK